MARPPTTAPTLSLPEPTTSSAPTKSFYNQTVHNVPHAPRVVPTKAPTTQTAACSPRLDPTSQVPNMAPTAQPTARYPSVFPTPKSLLQYDDPISHRTRSCTPKPLHVPTPDVEPISCRTFSSQGLANLADAEISPVPVDVLRIPVR